MAAELAQLLREWQKATAYGNPTDWVFASPKTHGRTPRVGNMLVADHLRPAAIKAGVVLKPGQRFGFHNLRHSLSSLLITGQKSDVRTTQDILRHSSSATTIDLYTQSPMAQRIAAQESVLSAILKQPTRRARIRGVRRASRIRMEKTPLVLSTVRLTRTMFWFEALLQLCWSSPLTTFQQNASEASVPPDTPLMSSNCLSAKMTECHTKPSPKNNPIQR